MRYTPCDKITKINETIRKQENSMRKVTKRWKVQRDKLWVIADRLNRNYSPVIPKRKRILEKKKSAKHIRYHEQWVVATKNVVVSYLSYQKQKKKLTKKKNARIKTNSTTRTYIHMYTYINIPFVHNVIILLKYSLSFVYINYD